MRPTKFTEKLGDEINERIAMGESIRTICLDEHMPEPRTIFRWFRKHKDFCHNYERAKEFQADYFVEEIIDISDNGANDWMEKYDKEGECIGWQVNGEHIQRSRLRVDVRKWAASKFKPKKYGDKLDIDHGGDITIFKPSFGEKKIDASDKPE